MNDDREIDEKLYRVIRKKDSHINTKEHPDGSKSAIQFSNKSNDLMGPVDLIEVDEDELIRTEYIKEKPPRKFREIMVEDVVAPIANEALEKALDIGYCYFEEWMRTTVVPKAKEKSKEFGKNIKIAFLAVKDGISGEETKAEQILRNQKKKKTTSIAEQCETKIKEKEKRQPTNKEIHSKEEIEDVVNTLRSSAITMAACIRWLNNAALENDDADSEKCLEIQRNLEELSSKDIMKQIDLLLEDKNQDLLDQASGQMISAFRDGNFLMNGEPVPIINYVTERGNTSHRNIQDSN